MLIDARFDSKLLSRIIGILFHGLLASLCLTVPALLLIQAKEFERFDVTAVGALTSFCRGSFKGHGGPFTHSTASNENAALCFWR
tara:strand:+ start:234 stop:488 length:255 start_codon:yes stop_codon:yes gene_type:complete